MRFYRYNKDTRLLTVVRLWLSHYRLKQDGPLRPLWFGSVSSMATRERLGLKYLITEKGHVADINWLVADEKTVITSKKIDVDNKKFTLFLLY